MRITSPAFRNGEKIPPQFTCDGDDVNPELRITGTPASAKSVVIIVDDPASPSGNWLHWSLWNLDPKISIIEEDSVPRGAVLGETDFSEVGYGGPCPSYGEHEYRFMVFALDTTLALAEGAPRHILEAAMDGHIIDEASLTGRYQRVKKEPRVSKKRATVKA
ncbi:YbhB/YbcL family Raf kinase inhibitor-like protein [Patescibacteria group bacterium]|nr:YbhB/YbcL family Raf kinase inhibitor-like protein [Patescibacteria group bacterium]